MHSQKGIAAVECVMVLIPLLTLFFAGVECTVALQRVHAIHRATAAAVRFLSLSKAGDPSAILKAQCLALTGSPEISGNQCQGTPLLPNTSLSNVLVCDAVLCPGRQELSVSGGGSMNLVTVRTQGMQMTDFPLWISTLLFPDIQISMVQVGS
jgi:Flp pilus assembly protein TadG